MSRLKTSPPRTSKCWESKFYFLFWRMIQMKKKTRRGTSMLIRAKMLRTEEIKLLGRTYLIRLNRYKECLPSSASSQVATVKCQVSNLESWVQRISQILESLRNCSTSTTIWTNWAATLASEEQIIFIRRIEIPQQQILELEVIKIKIWKKMLMSKIDFSI